VAILLVKGMAPLFVVAAVAILVLGLVRNRAVPLIPGPVSFSLAALVLWALLTWFWSTTPGETFKTGISLAATLFGGVILFAAGARLEGGPKRIFENGLMLGGGIGFGLIAFELVTDAWLLFHLNVWLRQRTLFIVEGGYTAALNPGLAATALFFWPWALTLWSRRPGVLSGLGFAAGFSLLLLSNSDAVGFGIVAGAAIFAAGLALPRHMPRILGVVIAVGVLAAPMVPGLLPDPQKPGPNQSWLTASAAHRIIIWNYAVGHIKGKPIAGSGFDATRGLYSPEDKIVLRFPDRPDGQKWGPTNYEPIPLHPHNAILQVWLELGVIGALIVLVLLVSVVRAISLFIEARLARAVALGSLTTGLAIASISFGIWQSWWLGSILLGGAFMVAVLAPSFGGKGRGKTPPGDGEEKTVEEFGGPKGPEPTRYGDWERKGRAIDF
jgi:O-antigen ligase